MKCPAWAGGDCPLLHRPPHRKRPCSTHSTAFRPCPDAQHPPCHPTMSRHEGVGGRAAVSGALPTLNRGVKSGPWVVRLGRTGGHWSAPHMLAWAAHQSPAGMGLSSAQAGVASLTQEDGVGLTLGDQAWPPLSYGCPGRAGRRGRCPLVRVKKAQLSRGPKADLALSPSSLRAAPGPPPSGHTSAGRAPCPRASRASWQEKVPGGHVPLRTPAVPELRRAPSLRLRPFPCL